MSPKRVAIIGAGPSGLVAAKIFLHSHPPGTFEPIVFEKTKAIGGLWPLDISVQDRLDPHMPTNQSRYTVSFSDLAWESVAKTGRLGDSSYVPLFPQAWHVGQYLLEYVSRYLKPHNIKLQQNVVSVSRRPQGGWIVRSISDQRHSEASMGSTFEPVEDIHYFDFLIMATGFFGQPSFPKSLQSIDGRTPVIHSAKFRNLADFPPAISGGKSSEKAIVIVGGSISGAEAAAAVAMQISDRKWSPRSPSSLPELDFPVYHLTTKPFWSVPHLLPVSRNNQEKGESSAPSTYLPLDLCFYDVARRQLAGQIVAQAGPVTPEKAEMIHGLFSSFIGSNQSTIAGGSLKLDGKQLQRSAWLAISDSYDNFVRARAIQPIIGRLQSVQSTDSQQCSTLSYVTEDDEQIKTIENVCGVIAATGYRAQSTLSILPKDVLDILGYDDVSRSIPLLLENASTIHPDISNLGFVGFYQGPFWAIMEMQARHLSDLWVGRTCSGPEFPGLDCMLSMRNATLESFTIPQFPMSDYVGYLETFAQRLGIDRVKFDRPEESPDTAVAARYLDAGSNADESSITILSLRQCLEDSRAFKYVAKAVFRALLGPWSLSRRLTSERSSHPSGLFVGHADFHPRKPTSTNADGEYLYVEEGEFTTEAGVTLRARRSYLYRYCESKDELSVWFVKENDDQTADYLFHTLDFEKIFQASSAHQAIGHHLCSQDNYNAEYSFQTAGIQIEEFSIKYMVHGPQKDYTSTATFRR